MVDLKRYRERRAGRSVGERAGFKCGVCGFPSLGSGVAGVGDRFGEMSVLEGAQAHSNDTDATATASTDKKKTTTLEDMPPEILIRIYDFLETEQLIVFMRA